MVDLVTLSFEGGDCSRGFPAVTARLWNAPGQHPTKTVGALPPAPDLVDVYRAWKLLYLALHQRLDWSGRITIAEADVTNVSVVEFQEVCRRLVRLFNDWLHTAAFRPIDQQLRTHLTPTTPVRLVVETSDRLLTRLPWHQWQLLDDFPRAEVALSTASYQRVPQVAAPEAPHRVKLLAVLGCSEGIDLEADRQYLTGLCPQADITFLVEPSLESLHRHLAQGCQVLFFGGHSSSEGSGILRLSRDRTLTVEQIRYTLKDAISQGLQLAIFNSCDGLALAAALGDLHIPQVIVMREPVPDQVAQAFLKQFLTMFTAGQPLFTAVRQGREHLQALEETYPCASWLPILCQNPAAETWAWIKPEPNPPTPVLTVPARQLLLRWVTLSQLLAASLGVTALVSGLRGLGWLQTWEFQAFDRLVQLRPQEPPEDRLLVIAVEESDFQLPVQAERTGSLSDVALADVLDIIKPAQPRSIGLDIYRDFPVRSDRPDLVTHLSRADNFFTICKGSDPATDYPGIAPPPEVPLEQQGFSDVVIDADGILRRHLLALNPDPDSPCATPYALSTQLALHYLAAEGIQAQFNAAGQLQLGEITLPRLRSRPGPYARTDLWGYQLLLNYRTYQAPENSIPVVSLAAVLEGQVPPEKIHDRIVLIGVAAPSAEDFIATPYRTERGDRLTVPGVILQAQMVSQLLSAVQDGRPLLHLGPLWADLLWIASWAGLGAGLSWLGRWPRRWLLALVLATLLLIGCSFVLLLVGWWVPLVPAALALGLNSGARWFLPNRAKL